MTFTLYWRNGKRELVTGDNLGDALERSDYSNSVMKDVFDWTVGNTHVYGWLGGQWVQKNKKDKKSKPVCETCNDTHQMPWHKDNGDVLTVMCTRCPAPCQKCRVGGNGPYCQATPCACTCHQKKAGVELWSDLTIPALLMPDFEEHVRQQLDQYHSEEMSPNYHDCEFCGASAAMLNSIIHTNDCLGIKLQALIRRQP